MHTIKNSKAALFSAIVLAVLLACFFASGKFHRNKSQARPRIETFRISEGWGYRILKDNRIYIDQPFIPGVSGKRPFPDRKSALTAAGIVRDKLLKGEIPVLTPEDLKKAGVEAIPPSMPR